MLAWKGLDNILRNQCERKLERCRNIGGIKIFRFFELFSRRSTHSKIFLLHSSRSKSIVFRLSCRNHGVLLIP